MAGEFSPLHQAPFGGEYYVFRDAVHNLIEIEDAEDGKYVRDILRTPELQRLRRIRQNGLNYLVYPSIETTRFPHSLGSFHIARRIISSLIGRQPKPEEGFPECLHIMSHDGLAFSVAALLHDIGHGPLSHVWEECWAIPRGIEQFHENMGTRIIADHDTKLGALLANPAKHQVFHDLGTDVVRFLTGKHHLEFLMPLLEGNLDVDRLDFIARDTRAAGVTYGAHDLEWIIRSLRFARLPARYLEGFSPAWVIAIDGRKGLSTLVQFLHARENMYRLVYHHKTTRAATRMMTLLFKRARLLAANNALSCHSEALRAAVTIKSSDQISPTQFLKLDDSDIWSSIKAWSEDGSGDPILRELASRLLSRDLFKVFLLSEDVYRRLLEVDSPEYGRNLQTLVKARLSCSMDDAQYYYAFDSTPFDVIGRPQKPRHDVWIMDSAALGFEFRTLREYWQKEICSPLSRCQYLLVVHPDVVQDLAGIVGRLSFPAESAKKITKLPEAPSSYRLVAPLGSEGAWKEVYVGVNTNPGSAPEKIVALKRYKTVDGELASLERDVSAINLLSTPHENLSNPRLLQHESAETWILEPLWTASLEDLLKRLGPRRDILEIFDIAEQLFSGLARLHSHKLRHTDIKLDNCGILATGSQPRTYVLGDFGCLSSLPDKMPSDRRLLGTLRTRPPEVLEGKSISLKSDVWSMAATIYAICLMEYPFVPFNAPHHDAKDRAEREKEIISNLGVLVEKHRNSVQSSLPPVLSRPLAKCFEGEQNRLSAQDAFQLFQDKRAELIKRNDRLLRTAWQRAEDIVQQLQIEKQLVRSAGLNEGQRGEVGELLTKYEELVPERLKSSLKALIPQG